MLRKRIITGLWGVPLVVLAAWFDEPLPWFTILAAVWGLLASFEFYRMTGVIRDLPLTVFGLLWTLLFVLRPQFDFPLSLLFTLAAVFSLILIVLNPQKEDALTRWAWMMSGIVYIGWLLSHLVVLRLEGGRGWVYLALLSTFASDTSAFFVGRALGRHHLAPRISPGKTWEGAVAGVFGAIIISLLFTLPMPLKLPLNYWQAIVLGVLVSVFGQFGDLAESLMKRNTGIKDSGTWMPGHGGVLDRTDSVIFAGVVVYLYYVTIVL